MTTQGDFYSLCHSCDCGSGLVSGWYKDERQNPVKACEKCKPKLLFRIFDDRFLDLFEDWVATILMDPPPIGYQWQWEDMLKERGCEQVVGLEEAKRRRKPGHLLISCPHGDSLDPAHLKSADRSVHILVPPDYAESAMEAGRMV
jgi:hypothetical protein